MYVIRNVATHKFEVLNANGNSVVRWEDESSAASMFEEFYEAVKASVRIQDNFDPSNKAAGALLEECKV